MEVAHYCQAGLSGAPKMSLPFYGQGKEESLTELLALGTFSLNSSSKQKDGKPKRPLSAYNLFFQHERQQLLESTPTRPQGKPRRSHGKIGFAALARQVAAKWKSIDADTRAYFDRCAAADKERYQREMSDWKRDQLVAVPEGLGGGNTASDFTPLPLNDVDFISNQTCEALAMIEPTTVGSMIDDDVHSITPVSVQSYQPAGINMGNASPSSTTTQSTSVYWGTELEKLVGPLSPMGGGNYPTHQQQLQQQQNFLHQQLQLNNIYRKVTPIAPQISELATSLDTESLDLLVTMFRH